MDFIKQFCLFAYVYYYCASPLVMQLGKQIDLDKVFLYFCRLASISTLTKPFSK